MSAAIAGAAIVAINATLPTTNIFMTNSQIIGEVGRSPSKNGARSIYTINTCKSVVAGGPQSNENVCPSAYPR